MPRNKKRKSRIILPFLMVILMILLLFLIAFYKNIGIEQLRYYIHKIEYKLTPEKFPNLSVKRDFQVYGIDVSHHNGNIDWKMVKEKGRINGKPIKFVFIKATEGKSLIDKNYKKNFKNAKNQDFIVSAYHFYQPHIVSKDQFLNFSTEVQLSKGDLPPVLDVELRGVLSLEKFTEGVLNILKLMEYHYQVKPILYTNPTLYKALAKNKEIKKYPLWLASYTPVSANQHIGIYTFLQYSESGKVAGINTKVDLNGFDGSMEKFLTYLIK